MAGGGPGPRSADGAALAGADSQLDSRWTDSTLAIDPPSRAGAQRRSRSRRLRAAARTLRALRTPAASMLAVIAASQVLQLLLAAADASASGQVAAQDPGWRAGIDLAAAAACVGASTHVGGAGRAGWVRLAAPWAVALALAPVVAGLASGWWLAQAAMAAALALGMALLRRTPAGEPRPYAALLRRLCGAALAALLFRALAVAAADAEDASLRHALAAALPAWHLFALALLALVPFEWRARAWVRESALLAAAATLAASLNLLLAARANTGPDAALALALAVVTLAYAGARMRLLSLLEGRDLPPSGEQMFESLYRAARDIEHEPARTGTHLKRLLRELFDPLDIAPHAGAAQHARVSPDGSTLIVPVPRLPIEAPAATATALRLRLARRGSRLFTREDARLAERVMEQLRRAVIFERAIEQGRAEERLRIAQDLHDDIGARLLTLMYKAHDPEIEEYLRHTLQDLKTLTRGLAAASHQLSHAAAEWKADITQRLAATECALTWSFSTDRDLVLSVTEWSALTRVLRELVNNIIAHARASEVEIAAQCERGRLVLQVSDDGSGRQPQDWSHGLGLGGVRKRVKALGGEVRWHERPEGGIRCELRVRLRGAD